MFVCIYLFVNFTLFIKRRKAELTVSSEIVYELLKIKANFLVVKIFNELQNEKRYSEKNVPNDYTRVTLAGTASFAIFFIKFKTN